MALVGGGGAGNTAGGNPAGTGSSLNYVLDRVYAFSGAIGCSDSETELLNFTTGSETISAKIKVAVATPAPENDNMRFIFEMDGTIVYQSLLWSGVGGTFYQSSRETVSVVLPPFTHFRVLGENITDNSWRQLAVIIAGKIINA